MAELIERIERASGPGRELDAEIMALFYKREARHIGTREGWDDEAFEDCIPVKDMVWVDPSTDKWKSTHALHFTASLDDAMTLVPEGWGWTIGDKAPFPSIAWCEIEGLPWKEGYGWAVERRLMVEAATPALALCAAALRARQATVTLDSPPAIALATIKHHGDRAPVYAAEQIGKVVE